MIKGIDVVLHEKVLTGYDEADKEVYSTNAVTVSNVLVAPASVSEQPEELHLNGFKATYTLAIPKGDAHNWEDSDVEFFDDTFHTIGEVEQGIDELIPLRWNKKITAVKYG